MHNSDQWGRAWGTLAWFGITCRFHTERFPSRFTVGTFMLTASSTRLPFMDINPVTQPIITELLTPRAIWSQNTPTTRTHICWPFLNSNRKCFIACKNEFNVRHRFYQANDSQKDNWQKPSRTSLLWEKTELTSECTHFPHSTIHGLPLMIGIWKLKYYQKCVMQ